MKFLVILCLLAFAAADEDNTQEKKTQPDTTQNTNSQTATAATTPTQPTNSLKVFPSTSFSNVFGPTDPISNLAYTGFNGNVSPIQPVNPDFFVGAPGPLAVNTAPNFPVTRTVLPGTNAVVNGIQTAFPGNVFPGVGAIPTAVNPIPAHFPTGILPTGGIDHNVNSPVISPGAAYRFLTPEALSGIPSQGLQAAQQVGLAAIPAFTGGILPSLANGVLPGQLQAQSLLQGQLQGQNLQQVLKNPTGTPGIANVQGVTTGNIPAGPLTNVFRHA